MKRALLIVTFVLVICVGALHQLGNTFYWYWNSFWFDGLMHFLGALAVGFLVLWIWYVSGFFGRTTPSKKEVMITALISVMTVSLGWEIFEYVYGIAVSAGVNYAVDTFHDLVFDFLGAVTVGIAGRLRRFYE